MKKRVRVPWDYFMKRRNISYASLVGMEYDKYAIWCHARYVVPLPQDEYEEKIAPFKKIQKVTLKTEEAKKATVPVHDRKLLNRKKKTDLVKLCKSHKLVLKGTETKKELVSLLIAMNNE